MRIQRIDISGFKSFNERAVIAFDDGITGIVGPNGCGKSNVVDAIRWVMGEQSAKHLRGRSMEDVIFNGSETQGPSGMAEVALTLRNDRPSELPAQYQGFGEITVSRRLFRDGRSDYLINRASCRLIDITELFLGTGVGTRAYSIIEQGKVGLIVNSKPEERRSLLEEAAGITKYKGRKKLAERKLDFTEQNLLRVSDIVGEMKRQLSGLDRQARKAEKYRELKDEMRQIELHAAALEWLEAQSTLRYLAERLAEIEQQAAASAEALETVELQRAEARDAALAKEADIEALRSRAHGVDLEAQKQAQIATFSTKQRADLERRGGQLLEEQAQAEQRLGELSVDRAALLELLAAIEEQLRTDEALQGDLGAQAAQRASEETALRQALESDRSRFATADSRAAGLRGKLAADERRRTEHATRADRLQTELQEHETRRVELTTELERCTGQTEETRQLRLALSGRKEELEKSLEAARRSFDDNEKQRRTLRDELADRRSRLKSLEDLQKNLEGMGRGVRAILRGKNGEPAVAGVRGLLADTVKAPQEIEVALEAFLAQRLQDIVVDDIQAALSGAEFLKGSKGGRATFVPLQAQSRALEAPPEHPECLGRALELVRVASGAEAVAAAFLGDVWVVRSAVAALALRESGLVGHLVTLDGDVFWASGALTAGTVEGAGVGALSQRREIEELTRLVADLQGHLELCQQRHAELSLQIATEDALFKSLSKDAQAQEVALAHQQQDVRRMTEQVHALEKRRASLSEEQLNLQRVMDELTQDQDAARRELETVEATAREAKERVEGQTESLRQATQLAGQARERLTELKVKVAGDGQRCQATRGQLQRNEQLAEELRHRLTVLEEEGVSGTARLDELARQASESAEKLAELKVAAASVAEEIAAAVVVQAELAAQVKALEVELGAVRAQLEAERTAFGKANLRQRETVLSLTHLETTISDRHSVPLALQVTDFHLLPPPPPERRERLLQLRESVAKMGEINLTAIQEHQELNQRYETLAQQKLDLEQSVAQLREAIVRINRTSRERFRETFELVNTRFSEVFPRLFRGGKAGLALIEEGGDVLEAGVEIFAQPPGKKLQSVDLLSGGEKALTAVALIFAIFLIKPTPFCLLDEVDAPLDEGNVGRYNDIVREISKISQFILITHNKRTMEIADTLYGVTMEEPGCSKLVSVKLNGTSAAAVAA